MSAVEEMYIDPMCMSICSNDEVDELVMNLDTLMASPENHEEVRRVMTKISATFDEWIDLMQIYISNYQDKSDKVAAVQMIRMKLTEVNSNRQSVRSRFLDYHKRVLETTRAATPTISKSYSLKSTGCQSSNASSRHSVSAQLLDVVTLGQIVSANNNLERIVAASEAKVQRTIAEAQQIMAEAQLEVTTAVAEAKRIAAAAAAKAESIQKAFNAHALSDSELAILHKVAQIMKESQKSPLCSSGSSGSKRINMPPRPPSSSTKELTDSVKPNTARTDESSICSLKAPRSASSAFKRKWSAVSCESTSSVETVNKAGLLSLPEVGRSPSKNVAITSTSITSQECKSKYIFNSSPEPLLPRLTPTIPFRELFNSLPDSVTAPLKLMSSSTTYPLLSAQPGTPSDQPNGSRRVVKSGTKFECPSCKERHTLARCKTFSSLSLSNRIQIVVDRNLCFNCLSVNHRKKDCKSKGSCRVCYKQHHTMLHGAS